jgi:hypothetical protein
MNIKPGIKLLEEREGEGNSAEKGDHLTYNMRIYLNKGDEVPINTHTNLDLLPRELVSSDEQGPLINHTCLLGRRQTIAAIEYSLLGMKPGGYRKIRTSPHLAARGTGWPDLVPPNAVLVVEIWLKSITRSA